MKDRILEFLGVRKLREDSRGPILCFSGPPGVGKTSLGRSIARAMGREFVRISLGGVRDEAEIRGHRRTYVGALPGRIIQAFLKQAGTKQPGVHARRDRQARRSDFRGDPRRHCSRCSTPSRTASSAITSSSVPFDLSKVLFIATANMLDPIPAPLRDRMEVIQLSGYTPEEKVEIATALPDSAQIERTDSSPSRSAGQRNGASETIAIRATPTRPEFARQLERSGGRRVIAQGSARIAPPRETMRE